MSAFAALKHSSRPGTNVHASNEISTFSQTRVEGEIPRPVKKRAAPGRPQIKILPTTQSLSGHQDTPIVYCVQPRDVDENKDEGLDKHDKGPLHAASDVTNGLDEVKPQDNWQDRKPVSLIHKLTLYSPESEIDIFYQGPVQELSTFIPTKDNVMGETVEEWTIRLNEADVNTCLWQYTNVFIS